MWDWKRLFSSTSKPHKPSALETAFLQQSKALADVMKRQQETIDKLQSTLDRIVAAKYDRPISAPVVHQPNPTMPESYMSDQGDVEGPDVASLLTVESDAEFLKQVGA